MTGLIVAAALVVGLSSAAAGEPAVFCAAAKKNVDADMKLMAAIAAAFGRAAFTGNGEDCVYPVQLLRYAGADVLVTQAGAPGEGCHGCGAVLSASVIQRVNGGLKTVGRFHEFASLGTHGTVADISPIEINGDDAMAIESGGTFQGYSSVGVDFFAFHAGHLVGLNAEPILIDADNTGASSDPSQAIEVTASWFFDPADRTALVVDYKIKAHGVSRVERVVWRLNGLSLVLSHGRVPPEVTQASGG